MAGHNIVGFSRGNRQLPILRRVIVVPCACVGGTGGLAFAIAVTTAKGRVYLGLFRDARSEIRRVVWPTRQELLQTTAIVVVFVLIVALLLWGLDSLVSWIVSDLIG